MKRKKLLYILLALNISVFLNIKSVSAADISVSAGTTDLLGNSGTGVNGGSNQGKTISPVAYGYRVSFVNPNEGNKTVGHSFDYWGDGMMVDQNDCFLDGYFCDLSVYDWNFISNYDRYGDNKTPIEYRYYSTKHNKTQHISGEGETIKGKYPLVYASKDFLITGSSEKNSTSYKYSSYLMSNVIKSDWNCNNTLEYRDRPITTHGSIKIKSPELLSVRPADKCYDNNYTVFAYYAIEKAAQKNNVDYYVFAKFLYDTGVVTSFGNPNESNKSLNSKIVSAGEKYVMLVEPLTAVKVNTHGNDKTKDPIYIGTVYELSHMGSNYGAITALGGGWTYDRYSYINPKVFNTQAAAGVEACNPETNDGGKLENLKKRNGCSGVFTVIISDITESCASKVSNLYSEYKSGKKTASQYDSEVGEVCEKDGKGDCEWLKVGTSKSNPNYSQYGINPSSIASCDKPTCSDVATSRFNADFKLENSWGISNNTKLIEKMIEDALATDTFQRIANKNYWSTTSNSFQNIFKFLTTKYKYSMNFGSKSSGTFNNLLLNKVLGKGNAGSNYCSVSTCQSVLNNVKGDLSKVVYGKTILEWLYLMYPKYDMLSPEFLKNEAGVIDYSLAACQGTPSCNTEAISASCQKGENSFTFTDLVSDDSYSGGSEFGMTVSTFAKLTSGTYATNPTCLNGGYAFTSINGNKLEQKNMQKSKADAGYNGESICWESVSFDLPKDVGIDKKISAGTVFRWGQGSDETDTSINTFGTMTVTRYCSVKPVTNNSVSTLYIGSEWANVINGKPLLGATVNTDESSTGVPSATYKNNAKINPEITLHYQEAVSSKFKTQYPEHEYKMGVELKNISTDVYARTSANGAGLTASIDPDYMDYEDSVCSDPTKTVKQCMDSLGTGDHPRRITLTRSAHSNFFNNGGVVYVVAKYNIVYTDDLKWYSDKSDNSKKVSATDIKNSGKNAKNANYLLLGYGLPTSFVTPTLPTFSKDYKYGNSQSEADGRGQMYVTIKNVGTKNGSTYHFDGLLKTSKNVLYDDDTEKKYSDALVYSCGFRVDNPLYDYEHKDPGTPPSKTSYKIPTNDIPKGIDVVFRTVELVDTKGDVDKNMTLLFPGRSGSGRKVGANWRKVLGDEKSDEEIVNYFSEKTYERDPKYVINLTPTLIQQIRKENKNVSYTSMSDYKFYKYKPAGSEYSMVDSTKLLQECIKEGDSFKCTKSTFVLDVVANKSLGEESKLEYTRAGSKFISKLISKGYLKGTCADEAETMKRTVKYAKNLGC